MTKNLFGLIFLCFAIFQTQLQAEMHAQAWITPLGTEITIDEAERGHIAGLGRSGVMVRLGDGYNRYLMLYNFHRERTDAGVMIADSLALRKIVRVAPLSLSEIEASNELWNMTLSQANLPYWLITDPESPDSNVVLIYDNLRRNPGGGM